jgi:hypothetical protein
MNEWEINLMSKHSELAYVVPVPSSKNEVWEKLYRAAITASETYKKKCIDELSFRVASLDSSYKYTLSIVGQPKHGRSKTAIDRTELHAVHVQIADGVPVSCKPGYSEGVPELTSFMKSSAPYAKRLETEIALFDTPDKWSMDKIQKIYPNVLCVGGDPLHACMALERTLRESHPLTKDFRKVFIKFKGTHVPSHRRQRYYSVEKKKRAQIIKPISRREVVNAYERLQEKSYQAKAYRSYRQYYIDIMAIKDKHGSVCAKPVKKGAQKDSTVGDLIDNYSEEKRFFYYQNIVLYRAKSGQNCPFGTTPNEAVMNQLKTYNGNVLLSTAERCRLTLDMFTFGKVVSMHMKRRAPPGMKKVGPGSCHVQAMAILRHAMEQQLVPLPKTTSYNEWRAKNKNSKKRKAAGTTTRTKRTKR